MAAGMGLTPEQRQILLQAIIQGGNSGMTDPALALQNILQAQGGPSAAQAIVAGLRNRLMPGSAPGVGGAPSPAIQAARGLSGEEPNYAKVDDRPGGVLSEPKPAKKDDIADAAKKLSEKTPAPGPSPAPTGNGILNLPDVPDVPEAGAAVRSAVSGSLRDAARRGQGAMPSERQGPLAITETITKAALRHGVDPVGLIKTAGIESRFNPGAKNPRSSAGGLFQFIDSTAKSYGLRNKYDAEQASDAAARLWKDNKDQLTRSLGREPTNGELYLAHQQGPAGALKIIKNPDATVSSTVGKAAAGLNAGSGMTNRQFANMWTRRMGGDPGTPQTAGQQAALLNEASQPGPADGGIPLPPRRPVELGGAPEPAPASDTDFGPDFGNAPDLPDLGPVTGADQADLGGDIPDIGGLLGGLDTGDAGGDEPSQFAQDSAEEEKEPDKPILPEEGKQAGGILSGGGLLGESDQDRVDLSRVFSPERLGGTGRFGRDQGPDPTGFKAPVGLPTAGPAAQSGPAAGILGTPSTGVATITPPQLKSIAPTPPLPPPRPSGIDVNLGSPALPPPRPAGIGGMGVELPPVRPAGLLTDALPPPRPFGIGGEVPLPPRRPPGLLGTQPGPQLGAVPSPPAVDPDRFARDPFPAPASPPALDPDRMVRDPPWQDPPKPQGLLGPQAGGSGASDDMFAKFASGAGSLSGLLGQASGQTSGRKRLSGSSTSPPLVPQTPLLTGGLLSNARAGIDLNRFFGLLSGRIG